MATRTAVDRKDLIEGLGKGLRVIECFDDDHVRLTPSEAAQRAGLTRTAARRYLLSLVHFGYAAHVITPGIVMLATYSDRALDAWVAEHEFGSFTPLTITDPAEFVHNVHAARALGYWVTEAQLDARLRGIAVPLKD